MPFGLQGSLDVKNMILVHICAGIYRVIERIRTQRRSQCGPKRLLCAPKIGRKLLLGKKFTPMVITMSQEDGQKISKSKI